jgi:hypothetical protein
MKIVDQQLGTLKEEDPDTYSNLPDQNPLRSLEGLRIATQEIIPQAFAGFLAMAPLTSELADHIVNTEVAEWDNLEAIQAATLRAALEETKATVRSRIETARIGADSDIAGERTGNSEALQQGEKVRQTVSEIKAGRVARWLVGATAPVFRWPVEAIRGLADSMEQFASEKPATFAGGMVTFGTVVVGGVEYFVFHTPPSVPLIITGVAGISTGALVQGIWNKKGKEFSEWIKNIGHKS